MIFVVPLNMQHDIITLITRAYKSDKTMQESLMWSRMSDAQAHLGSKAQQWYENSHSATMSNGCSLFPENNYQRHYITHLLITVVEERKNQGKK